MMLSCVCGAEAWKKLKEKYGENDMDDVDAMYEKFLEVVQAGPGTKDPEIFFWELQYWI